MVVHEEQIVRLVYLSRIVGLKVMTAFSTPPIARYFVRASQRHQASLRFNPSRQPCFDFQKSLSLNFPHLLPENIALTFLQHCHNPHTQISVRVLDRQRTGGSGAQGTPLQWHQIIGRNNIAFRADLYAILIVFLEEPL